MAHTVVKRVGGKSKLKDWIKSHLPHHNIYVEPFGGSFAVGLNLPRANENDYRVVYNDLDSHVYTFFKVLRENKTAFLEALKYTPYSRQEFEKAFDLIHSGEYKHLTEIEKARVYLISNRQSFAGKEEKTWSISRQGENICHTWANLDSLVDTVAEHLKYAFIENSDYKDIFRRWDSPETVFYIDPPYENVESDYYLANKEHGFNHIELANEILKLQGSVVVSYYDSQYIRNLYPGFTIYEKEVVKHMQTKAVKDKAKEILLVKESDWAKAHSANTLI